MVQILLFIAILSCFYSGSSASFLKRSGADDDSCVKSNFPKPPCCGISKHSGRLIGGFAARTNEFPWMVYLGTCGGSLINSQWVLTAAHCIHPNYPYTAQLGAHHCQNNTCEPSAKKIKIKKSIVHEGYIGGENNFYNDIALLQLEEPVTFNDAIGPICLPTADSNQQLDGSKAIVSGWGTFESGEENPDLVMNFVKIWSPKKCDEFRSSWLNEANIQVPIRANSTIQICGGGGSEIAVCFGDSGGPLCLKIPNEHNTEYYHQVGIISYTSARSGLENIPYVHTNVESYMDWIEAKILNNQD